MASTIEFIDQKIATVLTKDTIIVIIPEVKALCFLARETARDGFRVIPDKDFCMTMECGCRLLISDSWCNGSEGRERFKKFEDEAGEIVITKIEENGSRTCDHVEYGLFSPRQLEMMDRLMPILIKGGKDCKSSAFQVDRFPQSDDTPMEINTWYHIEEGGKLDRELARTTPDYLPWKSVRQTLNAGDKWIMLTR